MPVQGFVGGALVVAMLDTTKARILLDFREFHLKIERISIQNIIFYVPSQRKCLKSLLQNSKVTTMVMVAETLVQH